MWPYMWIIYDHIITLFGPGCSMCECVSEECNINITRAIFQAWLQDAEFVRVLDEADAAWLENFVRYVVGRSIPCYVTV